MFIRAINFHSDFNISFGAKRKNGRKDGVEENLLRASKKLGVHEENNEAAIKKLAERTKGGMLLGSGRFSNVWAIPYTNYALKVSNPLLENSAKKKDKTLTKKDKLNGVILKGDGFEVLERFRGADLSKYKDKDKLIEFSKIASSMP